MQADSIGFRRTVLGIILVTSKTWLWFSSLSTRCVKTKVLAREC